MISSLLYTTGTALHRAKDHGAPVTVLVCGHWIDGRVAAVDGHGAILVGGEDEHHVVRLEDIAAVRVRMAAPSVRGQLEPFAQPMPAAERDRVAG